MLPDVTLWGLREKQYGNCPFQWPEEGRQHHAGALGRGRATSLERSCSHTVLDRPHLLGLRPARVIRVLQGKIRHRLGAAQSSLQVPSPLVS